MLCNKFNFITKQTCKDFTCSVKGFTHLVQYVQENIPTLNIVPRTISQDDVENYFSLQRSRKAGGDITVADFFAGNKALSTHMMLNANEKTDKELGNYSRVAVTPHSNIVLHRSNLYKNVHRTKFDDWKPTDVDIKSYVPLYNTKSLLKSGLKRQLLEQFNHSLSNLRLPRSHVTVKLDIVRTLKLKGNQQHIQQFVHAVDLHLKKDQFPGPWNKDKFRQFLKTVKHSKEIRYHWNHLMYSIGMNQHIEDHTSLLGQVMKAFGRCRCITYIKGQGFGYNNAECDAIRQRLKYKGNAYTQISVKRSFDGDVASHQRCFNCGDADHFIKDCPLPKQRGVNRSNTVRLFVIK